MFAPSRSWSTMIAVVSPSSRSTSGRASVGMNPWTNALYVSLIRRCDSAAMVLNTSELLPDPETPVNTVSRRFGMSRLMSRRLFSRAPRTRIRSWLSATCCSGAAASVPRCSLIGAAFQRCPSVVTSAHHVVSARPPCCGPAVPADPLGTDHLRQCDLDHGVPLVAVRQPFLSGRGITGPSAGGRRTPSCGGRRTPAAGGRRTAGPSVGRSRGAVGGR
ncbi:hypothetical protein SDC9_182676 [bioreactor metagenome]|uniref:Uncharacterized protein n=1 Tax=bioreactor metagenome TaxID=1076179 RepID=A0A645H825_9ZZZZ